jgi:O-antigen/teichoic acid export membrane protein
VGLQKTSRSLLKHSGIYGLGQIFSRLASFLLLPVYTAYLSPTDYGILAILDLSTTILTILLSRGIVTAANRYHFKARDEAERERVWWTSFTFMAIMATAVVVPVWLLRAPLARLTLGGAQAHGSYYYTLALGTLWWGILGGLPETHIRVHKWSGIFVGLALSHLLLNIGLNLYFLIVLELSVTGILLGNLIAGGVKTVALLLIFIRTRGPYMFDFSMIRRLWQFGSPLIVTAFLAMVMHQSNRYFLRLFLDLEQVGIYSLAYTIGQAINTLFLLPFGMIWDVEIYEIAKQSNAKQIYVKTFQYFVYVLVLLMLGVSFFAQPLLELMVDPAYAESASYIPIICLAFIFFNLHVHFSVPVMLTTRTQRLLPIHTVAAVTNIILNLLMIPRLGAAGTAWASVLTFVTFSFLGLWRYRVVDQYDYPLLKCGAVLAGMAASYVFYRLFIYGNLRYSWSIGMAAIIWIAWGLLLLGPITWRLAISRKGNHERIIHALE